MIICSTLTAGYHQDISNGEGTDEFEHNKGSYSTNERCVLTYRANHNISSNRSPGPLFHIVVKSKTKIKK